MERNRNSEPRWFDPHEWDGQDSSVPQPRWEPDEIDRLLHPELFEGEEGEDPPLPPARRAPPERASGDEPAPAKAAGSGLFYKDGTEIPPTHPDHGPMHLLPRQENGSFSSYYYCSKAELDAMGIDSPPPRRHRRDGFTPERQEQFLEHIRGGASGREAARKIRISPTTAYNLYNSPDGAAFRAAWDEAARVTDIVLEDTAYDRAVNGQEEIVFHQGRRVGVRWKYDSKLLMQLLRARLPLKYAPLSEIEAWLRHRGIALPPDVDGALERLRAAEAEWGRRLPGEEALPQIEDRTVRPELPSSVRPEPVEGRVSLPSDGESEDGPSTGSGRTDQARAVDASIASTSSTSSGIEQPAAPPASSASPDEDGSIVSTSSTSPDDEGAIASTSSETGQPADAAAPPAPEPEAPPPDPGLTVYRPPPRPRIFLAG